MPHVKNLDRLAFTIGLGGVLLAIATALAGSLLHHDWRAPAFLLFAAAQIAAIVLGFLSKNAPLGKAAAITSTLLLAASLLTLA
jgi:hypothetical protein